jgi:uncharacterized membrane protein
MADLIVLGFDQEETAEAVRTLTGKLMKEHLIELEDAVVVVRKRDSQVQINQLFNPTIAGATSGALWGSLIGLLFLNPLFGAALGAAGGALSGALTDIGINDNTIREIGQTLRPGTSALFVLVRRAPFDRLSEALRPYNPKIIRTTLSYDNEAQLAQALAGKLQTPTSVNIGDSSGQRS